MSSEVQIAVIDQQDTQIVLAVPGVQGATGSNIPTGGTANQVLRKASSTNYDTNWSLVTSAMIEDGAIVNADVNASAAIAGTKISPNFGSQNVVTTGTSTAASFIPTSSSVPTNGVYLPSANNVAISTNGTGRLFVDASGNVGVKGAPSFSLHSIIDINNYSPALALQNKNTNGWGAELVFLGTSTTDTQAKIGALATGPGSNSGALAFYTASSGSYAERFRVRADGTFEIKGGGTAGTSPAVSVNPSAPANSMVMLSDGKVGLGTSNPATAFEIEGNQPQITIDTTTTGYTALLFATNGVNDGGIYYNGTDDRMEFYTADTSGNPQAVIDASGRLLVGTTSAIVDEVFNVTAGNQVGFYLKNTSGTGEYTLKCWNANGSGDTLWVDFLNETSVTRRGTIDYNRSAGQVRYNVTSDRRLKSDIEDAASALNVLEQVKVRSYTWTETGYSVKYGFIAQELNEAVPDAVKVGDESDEVLDPWAVDNAKLVPLLTKALQEAIGRIEALEAKVAALEGV
jgi:hypothetical protein